MKSRQVVLAILAISLAAPTLASAEFGSQGTIAIQGLPRLELTRSIATPPDGDSSSDTTLGIGVAAHYFAADHFSLGGGLQVAREWDDGAPETLLLVQALTSYQVELRPRLHLWRQAVLGVMRQSAESSSNPALTAVAVSAYAPATYEIADHFVIGWGPMVATTLVASFERNGRSQDVGNFTQFGAQVLVAGWF